MPKKPLLSRTTCILLPKHDQPFTLDLAETKTVFDGAPTEYQEFLRINHKDATTTLRRLEANLIKPNLKAFRLLKHNMASTVHIFRLTVIRELLQKGKTALSAEQEAEFKRIVTQLIEQMTLFREALAEELAD